jgi:alkylhydroperoxidase family enzyme
MEGGMTLARVPYLDREDLRPEDGDIYDDLVARRGSVANLFRVLAHSPGLLRRLLGYSDYVRHNLSLDPHLRELAILTVGRVCGVEYEFTHHWYIARSIGLPQEKLDALGGWEGAAVFTDRECAVIRYSEEATRDIRVRDETFNALRDFLDIRQIVELVQVVGYYNMIVRILAPLGVELEPGLAKAPLAAKRRKE